MMPRMLVEMFGMIRLRAPCKFFHMARSAIAIEAQYIPQNSALKSYELPELEYFLVNSKGALLWTFSTSNLFQSSNFPVPFSEL